MLILLIPQKLHHLYSSFQSICTHTWMSVNSSHITSLTPLPPTPAHPGPCTPPPAPFHSICTESWVLFIHQTLHYPYLSIPVYMIPLLGNFYSPDSDKLVRLFDLRFFVFFSVSSSSWCLGRAAGCDCGTPWTFSLILLPFLHYSNIFSRQAHNKTVMAVMTCISRFSEHINTNGWGISAWLAFQC